MEKDCVLKELVQYKCEIAHIIRCTPVVRLFKCCPGRPMSEITPIPKEFHSKSDSGIDPLLKDFLGSDIHY